MSRSVPPRLLVGCATAALAAGLFAAPAAQAAPGPAVTAPTVVPGTYLDTGYTDGCNATGTPGWVGVSFPGPALYARTTAPAARFKVWDASGAKVIDGTADADPFGGVQVSAAGLPEGAGYTWQVWPQYRPGSGEPTATCRFGVDNTPPTALTAHSQDFPEHGGGRYAGQPGTFTFSAADTGSGLACFRYVLDDTPSTGGCAPGEGVVLPDADGTASVTLKPARWGSHVLLVQALDHAGNATQPLLYSFYAPQDPNPPKTLGDVDNDGVPDILLPDSQGNLLVIGGDTGGPPRAPWCRPTGPPPTAVGPTSRCSTGAGAAAARPPTPSTSTPPAATPSTSTSTRARCRWAAARRHWSTAPPTASTPPSPRWTARPAPPTASPTCGNWSPSGRPTRPGRPASPCWTSNRATCGCRTTPPGSAPPPASPPAAPGTATT
ncbi:hypothetical protein ACFQ2M_17185 [Kitasatospora saccharophila]|uniref:hypothetical protein n=1 Tax=Kitasatospora saccharophila TaxID=407973 RepID=UPI00362FF9BF